MAGRKKASSPKPSEKRAAAAAERGKRSYLSQAEVPGCVLDEALRVPRAIAENYAAKPASPLNVAAALEMQPNAGRFRLLTRAAIAYGVTSGGPNAPEIAITPLGMRIVRPTKEGDDLLARREALLRPRVVGEFLQKYNGAPLPRADIAVNVLLEMSVPPDRADEVLDFIVQGAESVGLLREIKGKKYVDLVGVPLAAAGEAEEDRGDVEQEEEPPLIAPPAIPTLRPPSTGAQERRVFITHGKNKGVDRSDQEALGDAADGNERVSKENKRLVREITDVIWNRRGLHRIPEFYAPDFVADYRPYASLREGHTRASAGWSNAPGRRFPTTSRSSTSSSPRAITSLPDSLFPGPKKVSGVFCRRPEGT